MPWSVRPPQRRPRRLRIAVIAAARFPIREPFAGGLEAHTWQLATELERRGHEVTVFAGEGSDRRLRLRPLRSREVPLTPAARADVSCAPGPFLVDHHAYLDAMLELSRTAAGRFDVVHNNSVHHLPLAMAEVVGVPQVTTLHCPPTPWLELAVKAAPRRLPIRFCAVSRPTARAWEPVIGDAAVITNAVDLDRWRPGPGGDHAVWTGRIVPEKGLDLAIDAARRAGLPLRFAGPIHDQAYWRSEIVPRLGPDVGWAGHLDQRALAALVGSAAVALVSPRWDEPFGLVALEAMACGTPVAALGRGGLRDLLDERSACMAATEDADGLADAATAARGLDRAAVRRRAEEVGAVERMGDEYLALYRAAAA